MDNKKIYDPSQEEIDRFLEPIGQVESSGGKNKQHKTIKKGILKGQTAGGTYGIIPSSLKDVVLQEEQRGVQVDPKVKALSQLKDYKAVTKALNEDPELDRAAANTFAKHMLTKTEGDQLKAAYGWNMGHNRDFNKLPTAQITKSDYGQRWLKAKEAQPSEGNRILDPEKHGQMRKLANIVQEPKSGMAESLASRSGVDMGNQLTHEQAMARAKQMDEESNIAKLQQEPRVREANEQQAAKFEMGENPYEAKPLVAQFEFFPGLKKALGLE